MTSALSEQPAVAVGDVRPASAPVAAPAASRVAVVLALGVVAAGAVGIREALVDLGWIGGTRWLQPAVDAMNGLTPATWMVAAGVALCALGVALVAAALVPRRRTAIPVATSTLVYLHRADLPKVASAIAEEVPGVLEARTSVSRRKVVVRCRVTGQSQQVQRAVADAVAEEIDVLRRPHRVVVRARVEAS